MKLKEFVEIVELGKTENDSFNELYGKQLKKYKDIILKTDEFKDCESLDILEYPVSKYKDGKVLFMFDMDVIVELTVDDKFETVVIVEYDDKFDIKVELDIKDGIVALMFAIPVVRLPNEVVWLSNCEYVVN